MIVSLLYDNKQTEIQYFNECISNLAAELTDERWEVEIIVEQDRLISYFGEKPLVNMMLYDVMRDGDVDNLIRIRSDYQNSHVMILADENISPMKYIRPGINAQSLLLRPYSNEQAISVLRDFFCEYIRDAFGDRRDQGASLLLESREEKISIPLERIYYIEAMEKKVYVCTGAEEYGYYSTLDKLENDLPDNFVRCHRSFIVNTDKIKKVALSKNTIYLAEEYEVPLSRSYKAKLKGLRYDGAY